MKQFIFCLLFLAITTVGIGQEKNYNVNFITGTELFNANVDKFKSTDALSANEIYENRFYRYIQFNSIPDEALHLQMSALGIKLLSYIPNNTYIASIPMTIDFNQFEILNIRAIQPIKQHHKVGTILESGIFPAWAVSKQSVKLTLKYYKGIDVNTIKSHLIAENASIIEDLNHSNILVIQIPIRKVDKLLTQPFVNFIDVISEPGKAESDDGRNLHNTNAIDGDYYGARDYDGTGISIAINDDGAVGPHIDFTGRVNQQDVGGPTNLGGTHGDMTTGIAGGAGNLDPLMRGMATGSYIHVRDYNASLAGTIPLHQDSSVLIFSSSYSNGCNAGYTNTTVLVDQEIYNNPTLMQVFSAGNSNNLDCGYGAGTQWGNVTGGHKIGKNVIATANLDNTSDIAASSSRGPASDGRIKPDISAHGAGQMSTDPYNTYAVGGGTSAAAPGIAGVMAQLHQAYSELNGGNTCPSALLKSALLVTADDLGNVGPDYTYGWGKVNGLAAVKLLETNHYIPGVINQGMTNTHQINIPSGVHQAKIMVYWADNEASPSSATALINDLDATIVSPSGATFLPWVLDHTPNPTTLALPATTGVDHLNNVEEIALDFPSAGVYTLDISGTTIPFGNHEYYVVYEFLSDEITVTHPMGGEGLMPNTVSRIHWNAYGSSGDFVIEYTEDNGTSWNTITSIAPGNSRIYDWNVPNTITGQAKVRVSRSGISDESDANFSIIDRPENLHISKVCIDSNYIRLDWDAVAGATSYDVFKLGQAYMDSIGTTSATYFHVPVNNINDVHWLSVRALGPNGIRSLRQIAVEFNSATGGQDCFVDCGGLGNDAGIAQVLSPGPSFENCDGLNTSILVSVELENVGLFNQTNFDIHYQLNNAPIVTETFTNTLTPSGGINYDFTTPIIISASGTYSLTVWTSLANDDASCNDTVLSVFQVNYPIDNFPIIEDYENPTFPPTIGTIINNDADLTWVEATVTGATSALTKAMVIENFIYNAAGEEDIFKIVPIDLSQVNSGTYLTFDVAYKRYSGTYYDGLRVDVSDDCGQTFNAVYFKQNLDLATGSDELNYFSPNNDSDWRNDSVDLSPYAGSTIIIRFVNICGWGNNLYIDNINIDSESFLNISNSQQDISFKSVPNPAHDRTELQFTSPLNDDYKIEVITQSGQILINSNIAAGESSKTLDLSSFAPAIYYVKLSGAQNIIVQKLVVK